ncbi:MAG: methyl-accepting chemotaxis protein [Lachnospiraceae bacterium]|nr:methyl-accepting chemotaxis protein [Lachnospiraceae bacterium]
MKNKSIFKQMLIPMIGIVTLLAVVLVTIIIAFFTSFYKKEIQSRNEERAGLLSESIQIFVDGAYNIAEELAVNPSILSMQTEVQTPILENCTSRNPYFELLYVQGADGMQTGRSSGILADRSLRWWFIQVMDLQKPFVSKSYYSVNTGMPCASIFFPMYKQENLIGVFAADLKLDYLQSMIHEYSNTQYKEISFVIDGEGIVVAHPDSIQIEEQYNYKTLTKTISKKDANGQVVTDANGNIITEEQKFEISEKFQNVIQLVMAGNSGVEEVSVNGKSYYISYVPIPLKGESDSWSVLTMQEKSAAIAVVNRVVILLVIIVFVFIMAAVAVITVLARKLTRPIIALNQLAKDATEGNFSIQADESNKNELGMLSKSFNSMIAKISGVLNRLTAFSAEVVQSSGHLDDIERNIGIINESVHKISKGTEEQKQDAEQVLLYTNDMIKKFERLMEQGQRLMDEAKHSIESGKSGIQNVEELTRCNQITIEKMENSYKTIINLEEQSKKVFEIVNTINDISSKTKMLSLNAGIEAARSGEQGRGFSVVAKSIGGLASDSATATLNIEQIIQEFCAEIENMIKDMMQMKEDISNQSEAVTEVGHIFTGFEEMNGRIADSVTEMEHMIQEMYQINNSIAKAVDRISDISKNTAQLTEKSSLSLQEQYNGISVVAERVKNLSAVSAHMEEEMTMFNN